MPDVYRNTSYEIFRRRCSRGACPGAGRSGNSNPHCVGMVFDNGGRSRGCRPRRNAIGPALPQEEEISMKLETCAKLAIIGAALIGIVLLLTACKTSAGAGLGDASWSGGITCKDGICTPTLTIGYSPKPQLEK